MATSAAPDAMAAAGKVLTQETQQEMNTPFHMAKWMCFLNCFPLTEPVEKIFFLFGAGVERNLVCIQAAIL